MTDRTDRRCFLARGVIGAAGLGIAHGSIEENTFAAAIQDGTTQTDLRRRNPKPTFLPAACRAARSATCPSAGS